MLKCLRVLVQSASPTNLKQPLYLRSYKNHTVLFMLRGFLLFIDEKHNGEVYKKRFHLFLIFDFNTIPWVGFTPALAFPDIKMLIIRSNGEENFTQLCSTHSKSRSIFSLWSNSARALHNIFILLFSLIYHSFNIINSTKNIFNVYVRILEVNDWNINIRTRTDIFDLSMDEMHKISVWNYLMIT
jgi:hypothetical protein